MKFIHFPLPQLQNQAWDILIINVSSQLLQTQTHGSAVHQLNVSSPFRLVWEKEADKIDNLSFGECPWPVLTTEFLGVS